MMLLLVFGRSSNLIGLVFNLYCDDTEVCNHINPIYDSKSQHKESVILPNILKQAIEMISCLLESD